MRIPYIEDPCTVHMEGREFTANGAAVTDDYCIAYVGARLEDGSRALNDWHGNQIGTCRITATWRTPRSFLSATQSQVYATVEGRQYTGRSIGQGFIFRGRRVRRL